MNQKQFCTGLIFLSVLLSGGVIASDAAPDIAVNGGAEGNSRYWPLSQISRDNVSTLKVAWRRPAVDASLTLKFPDLSPSDKYEASPLVVDDVAYVPNGVGLVEAFDAANGKTLWIQEPLQPGLRGVSGRATRSVAYWHDGKSGEQRIIGTNGEYLFALDATNGKNIQSFGEGGHVNMHLDTPYAGRWSSSSGPVIVSGVIVVGGTHSSGGDFGVKKEAAAENIRGLDVRTGKLLWTFHVVPQAGEFGNETWGRDSWKFSGAAGAWAALAVDPQLGYVYVPTSAPSNSWYGGDRPGANLFANSLLCLDAKTGKRIWHFQLVHHDLWDYDVASPPTLGDVRVNGKTIKAVFQPVKSGFVFVFDRVTGKPLWPIEERPVPASKTPGEQAFRTQPFPTKPAAIDRQGVMPEDLIDFTPELHAEAVKLADKYEFGPLYAPPSISVPGGKQGVMTLPGTAGAPNWGGGAFDPESGIYYVASHTQPWVSDLVPPPASLNPTLKYIHGPEVIKLGNDATAETYERYMPQGPQHLPLVKPPYARITAIDMKTGDHLWMSANGDGPRRNPALTALNLPPLGSSGRVAPLLTKTLLFAGEGSLLLDATPVGMGGRGFRAFDKATGREVWKTELDAGTTGAPVTYLAKGRQYIVVAIGDENHHAELVALALP